MGAERAAGFSRRLLEGGEHPRQRQAVLPANAELRERELIKLASLDELKAVTTRPLTAAPGVLARRPIYLTATRFGGSAG